MRKFWIFGFVMLLCASFASAASEIAWWKFSDDWTDSVGTYDGTPTNSPTFSTTFRNYNISGSGTPKSAQFTATSSQYVTIGDFPAFSFTDGAGNDKPFSICFDAQVNSHTSFAGIISKADLAGAFEWIVQVSTDGRIRLTIYKSDGSAYLQQNMPFTDGVMYNFCYVYDGSETMGGLKAYRDASTAGNTSLVYGTYTGMSNTVVPVYISAYKNGASLTAHYDGIVDNIQIFDYALSSQEVMNIYDFGNIEGPEIFQLTASNLYNGSSITNFTAQISNGSVSANITTTNGSIYWPVVGELVNITIFNITGTEGIYFNQTYENYNTSSSLEALLMPRYYLNDVLVTSYKTYGGQNYSKSLQVYLNYTCPSSSDSKYYLRVNDVIEYSNNLNCINNYTLTSFSYQHDRSENSTISIFINSSEFSGQYYANQSMYWDEAAPQALISYSIASYFNNTAILNLTCIDDVMNFSTYNLTFDSNNLFYANLTNGTSQINTSPITSSSSSFIGACSDLFSTSSNTTAIDVTYANISLINEQTGLPFNIANLTSAKLYLSQLSYLDLKSINSSYVTFISENSTSFWFEFSNDGGTILRYIDMSLLDTNSPRVCVNYQDVLHYEQLFISATSRPVFVKNIFSNCYILADYTRFSYQDSLSTRAFSIESSYEMYIVSSGAQVFLANIDGGVSTYRNIDTLEFSKTAYSYSIQEQYVTTENYDNQTIQIYYNNQRNDSVSLTMNIYDAASSALLFSKSDFADPNEVTLYFDYSTFTVTNSTLFKIEFIGIDSSGEPTTTTKYSSTIGKGGMWPAPVALAFSLIMFIISITTVAMSSTFRWVGHLGTLGAIFIASFGVQEWYLVLVEAVYFLALISFIIIFIFAENQKQARFAGG